MKALLGSRSRFIKGLAVSAGLALVAIPPPAAHAAGTPTISASVIGFFTLQVSGSGFGPGDRVEVTDSFGGKVFTTASRFILPPPPPKCTSKNPCLYGPALLGGTIHVTMPKHATVCALETVTVRATDLTDHTHSNVVRVIVGEGFCA